MFFLRWSICLTDGLAACVLLAVNICASISFISIPWLAWTMARRFNAESLDRGLSLTHELLAVLRYLISYGQFVVWMELLRIILHLSTDLSGLLKMRSVQFLSCLGLGVNLIIFIVGYLIYFFRALSMFQRYPFRSQANSDPWEILILFALVMLWSPVAVYINSQRFIKLRRLMSRELVMTPEASPGSDEA